MNVNMAPQRNHHSALLSRPPRTMPLRTGGLSATNLVAKKGVWTKLK